MLVFKVGGRGTRDKDMGGKLLLGLGMRHGWAAWQRDPASMPAWQGHAAKGGGPTQERETQCTSGVARSMLGEQPAAGAVRKGYCRRPTPRPRAGRAITALPFQLPLPATATDALALALAPPLLLQSHDARAQTLPLPPCLRPRPCPPGPLNAAYSPCPCCRAALTAALPRAEAGYGHRRCLSLSLPVPQLLQPHGGVGLHGGLGEGTVGKVRDKGKRGRALQ